MQISYNGLVVAVIREKGERRARSESDVFYRLRNTLRSQGQDVIKRIPAKDGHLTGAPYYIRERKWAWCVYDPHYAVRDAAEDFNRGVLELRRESLSKRTKTPNL